MNKFFVIQNSMCPGTEFATYLEAREYLNVMRLLFPKDWTEGLVLGPGLDD